MDTEYDQQATLTDFSKRCNCKKARCLKLYCVCFAAGKLMPLCGRQRYTSLHCGLLSSSGVQLRLNCELIHNTCARCVRAPSTAGVYCNNCACRDCKNSLSCQNVVMFERQKILQRSPRAFAPKASKMHNNCSLPPWPALG